MIKVLLFPPEKLPNMGAVLSKLATEKGLFPLCCTQIMVSDPETGAVVPGGILYTLGQQVVTEDDIPADDKANGHAQELGEPEILKGQTTVG